MFVYIPLGVFRRKNQKIFQFQFVIAILNFPLGEFETNDQCAVLRFSKAMEAVRVRIFGITVQNSVAF